MRDSARAERVRVDVEEDVSQLRGLERFERDIREGIASLAPNGLVYWVEMGDGNTGSRTEWVVVRKNREDIRRIVGFNGSRFFNLSCAESWAIADGRAEFEDGVPLCDRKQLI